MLKLRCCRIRTLPFAGYRYLMENAAPEWPPNSFGFLLDHFGQADAELDFGVKLLLRPTGVPEPMALNQ